jgi:hypothetical protein
MIDMQSFGNIAFGVRIGGMVDPSFFHSWTRFIRSDAFGKEDALLNPPVGFPHGPACHILASLFLETNCDSMMFIDDDMEFTPQGISELRRDDCGKDVLSCLYACRKPPHRPLAVVDLEECGRPIIASNETIARETVVPVKYVGFGGVIIKRWVIEELAKKYGNAPMFEFGIRGEDGRFCDDARGFGAEIAVKTSVRFGHRVTVAAYWNSEAGDLEFNENDYGLGCRNRITKEDGK